MSDVVIEHVKISQLPKAWQKLLAASTATCVTVRIETETAPSVPVAGLEGDGAFGMWKDRKDMENVAAYVKEARKPRYTLREQGKGKH